MNLAIEPLTIADLEPATTTLYPAFTRVSERYLGHPDAVPLWVGNDEEIAKWIDEKNTFKVSIAGRLVAGFQIDVQDPDNSWLNVIWVSPEEQGKGIGQQIWHHLESTYDHVKTWYLETAEFAVANHFFYEKLGFVKQRIQRSDSGINVIVYRKQME